MSLLIRIHLVDGGLQERHIPATAFLQKHGLLVSSGLDGKALVDELFGDDWGLPPQRIEVTGSNDNSERVNIRISYR